jgi:hypothetical protein
MLVDFGLVEACQRIVNWRLLICAQSAVDDNATATFLDGEITNFDLIGNKEPEIVRKAPEQAVK